MTTVTLSDGSVIPKHYDFNERFPNLPLHNQGQTPICWYETKAAMIEAFSRMYDGQSIRLDPAQLSHADTGWAISHWKDLRPNGFSDLGTMTYYKGREVMILEEFKNLSMKEAICKALWLNGILEGSVSCQHSFERLWKYPHKYMTDKEKRLGGFHRLPRLNVLPGDLRAHEANNWSHTTIYTGFHWDHGILDQNSWGKIFGFKGRCYLGWDMVEAAVVRSGYIWTWNEHPANGLKMPAKRST